MNRWTERIKINNTFTVLYILMLCVFLFTSVTAAELQLIYKIAAIIGHLGGCGGSNVLIVLQTKALPEAKFSSPYTCVCALT